MSAALTQILSNLFPQLGEPGCAVLDFLAEHGRQLSLKAGAPVFYAGDACLNFILVLNGTLRVQKVSADGHEIVLFKVSAGNTCNLTNTCLLASHAYPAEGIADTDCEVLLVGTTDFHQALTRFESLRQLVFGSIDNDINNIVDLLEAVAFEPLNQRLAHLLILRAGDQGPIRVTHQALATELGTAREVVSRLLKEFEALGLIHRRRGKIQILDMVKLRVLGQGGG